MNAPVIRFETGDQPRIDGTWWIIQEKTPAGLHLYPLGDAAKSLRFFDTEELFNLYKTGRLQIMRRGGFKYHNDEKRVLASFSENARREMSHRAEYMRACDYFFEHLKKSRVRHKYLKTIRRLPDGVSDWPTYIERLKANDCAAMKIDGYWRIAQIVARYHRMKKQHQGHHRTVVGASTLRTWYRTWLKCQRQETSMLPGHHRKGGGNQLDPRVTDIIAATVRTRWLTLERPPVSLIHSLVEEEICRKKEDPDWATLSTPSRMAVHRWIERNVSRWDKLAHREGKDVARSKLKPLDMVLEPDRPLEIVEMDHTMLNVFLIVDPSKRRPKGKPPETRRAWLTVAIDVATRMILGFHIDFAAPSWKSVGEALRMGIQKKEIKPEENIDSVWPAMGVPEILRLDNGPEFHSDSMKAAAAELLMELRYCPPGAPHLKGRVERFFRDVADDYCAMLPGRTFTIKAKGDHSNDVFAVMSIEDAKRLFKKWVVDIYHRSRHGGLHDKSPLTRWQELSHHGVRLPPSVEELNFALGKSYFRTIDPRGVRIFGLHYSSDDVKSLPSRILARKDQRYEVRVDPMNLSTIQVLDPKDYIWLEAKLREVDLAEGLDLESWLMLCAQGRENLRPGQNLDREVLRRARRGCVDEIDKIRSKNIRPRRFNSTEADAFEDEEIVDHNDGPDQDQSSTDDSSDPSAPLLGPNPTPFGL